MSPLYPITVLNPFPKLGQQEVKMMWSCLVPVLTHWLLRARARGGYDIRQVWARVVFRLGRGCSLVNHGLEIQYALDEFGSKPGG